MKGQAQGAAAALRREIVETCRAMNARGINRGTSGNVGARCGDRLLITPSGLPYEAMSPEDIVALPLDADDGRYEGALAPPSERSEQRRVGQGGVRTCQSRGWASH